MYEAVTRDVRVTVTPLFLAEESMPDMNRFVWSYTITITNNGRHTVQLLSRYWHIVDGLGRVQEVRGAGVIGKQPILARGESHTYTSGCPLDTPEGSMSGTFRMLALESFEFFDVEIPLFPLQSPHAKRTTH
jgi:ApaG protein